MSKNMKGIVTVVFVAALAGGAYLFFHKTKLGFAKNIVKLGGTDYLAGLMLMDEPYLAAWSKGLDKGEPTFSYNGKNYHTSGGKAVV